MYTLRAAQATDQQAIKQLIRENHLNPAGLKWPNFVVAEDEQGRFIGCGQIKPHGGNIRELASLAVVKEWRGRDVARALINRLVRDVSPPLYLMCNSRLVPFYEKFGFAEIKDAAAMPAIFRWYRRFVGLMIALTRSSDSLAVMVRWDKIVTKND